MLAKDALKSAVQEDFVPALREAGFTGTYPTWRLRRDDDVAVVSIQAGQYNEGSHGTFFVRTTVVTPAWWAWTHECAIDTPWGSDSKPGRELAWDGLFLGSLRRAGAHDDGADEWRVGSVAAARTASGQMTAALRDGGMSSMLGLMGAGRMLAAFQAGELDEHSHVDDRPGMRDIVLAVLLSDGGGEELESVCRRLDEWAGREYSELPLATARWARQRAESFEH